MQDIERILCVVDPEHIDSPAVNRAVWLAQAADATLDLLAVYHNDALAGNPSRNQSMLEKSRTAVLANLRNKIQQAAEELQVKFGITVLANAIWSHPAHEGIVSYASDSGAGLVLKDAEHHSALRITLFSNQDWQLIRDCRQPLWIVKLDTLPDNIRFLAAIDPMHRHDKPAQLDDTILRLGKLLADVTAGSLHAFHAFDPRIAMTTAESNAYIPVSLPVSSIEEELREAHVERFSEVVEPYDLLEAQQHIVTGLPDEELPRIARELNATAVIMGAVARNALKRIFIGSTAERTLSRLSSDLIIVKPDWFGPAIERTAIDKPLQTPAALSGL